MEKRVTNFTELKKYADKISELTTLMADVMCLSEDIADMEITKKLKEDVNYHDSKLFQKIAKIYAKKANDRMGIDLDNCSVQAAQALINEFNYYCDENNWFGE